MGGGVRLGVRLGKFPSIRCYFFKKSERRVLDAFLCVLSALDGRYTATLCHTGSFVSFAGLRVRTENNWSFVKVPEKSFEQRSQKDPF